MRPEPSCQVLAVSELGSSMGWLAEQSCPVIAYGAGSEFADVVVDTREQAEALALRVTANPVAALTLVQVLRMGEMLPPAQALDLESMAYATLQGGEEFANWRRASESGQRDVPARAQTSGPPILLERRGDAVFARLNRPQTRNSMTIELRDAWVEMLNLLALDPSIRRLQLDAAGPCFSVGGALEEFGTRPDTATAHWVRTVHSPARLMLALGRRVTVRVHGACIGSGIELPAFAGQLEADAGSFFQLPELAMGLIPGAGGTVSIARRIGRQRTAWWVLTARRIRAATALDWGLIDRMVSA